MGKCILLIALFVTPCARPRTAFPAHVTDRRFEFEMAALTLANSADGFETARDSRMGLWEAPWPKGSREILGRYPSAGRYALVMGTEELLDAYVAGRLERSRHAPERFAGHALMWSATSAHIAGVIDCVYWQHKIR